MHWPRPWFSSFPRGWRADSHLAALEALLEGGVDRQKADWIWFRGSVFTRFVSCWGFCEIGA